MVLQLRALGVPDSQCYRISSSCPLSTEAIVSCYPICRPSPSSVPVTSFHPYSIPSSTLAVHLCGIHFTGLLFRKLSNSQMHKGVSRKLNVSQVQAEMGCGHTHTHTKKPTQKNKQKRNHIIKQKAEQRQCASCKVLGQPVSKS